MEVQNKWLFLFSYQLNAKETAGSNNLTHTPTFPQAKHVDGSTIGLQLQPEWLQLITTEQESF